VLEEQLMNHVSFVSRPVPKYPPAQEERPDFLDAPATPRKIAYAIFVLSEKHAVRSEDLLEAPQCREQAVFRPVVQNLRGDDEIKGPLGHLLGQGVPLDANVREVY
jgi:hypothetical protein